MSERNPSCMFKHVVLPSQDPRMEEMQETVMKRKVYGVGSHELSAPVSYNIQRMPIREIDGQMVYAMIINRCK